jgi:signal transduction histidine kinase
VNDDKLRLWRIFTVGRLVVTGVFLALVTMLAGFPPPASLRSLSLLAEAQFLANAVYFYLWRRRDLALLGYIAFGLEIVLITLLIYFLGPDGFAFVLAYLWPIMMAGWLIGRMAIPVFTSASGIAYAVLVILRQRGTFPVERLATPDGTSLALILSLPYLAFIALLVWLITSEMERGEEHLKHRNTALQSLNTRLRALVSASEELLGCLDMQQLLSSALVQVERVTGHTQSAIQVRRNGAPLLQRERDLPLAALPAPATAASVTTGPNNAVTLSQELLSAAESARLTLAGTPPPHTLTHVALRSPHGLEGTLTIASSAELPLDADQAQPLLILGHQLSIALENARFFDDLQHDRNLLRGILARMGEGVFVVDAQGSVLLANRAAWQLLQVAEGRSLPDDLAAQMASYTAAEQPSRPIPLEVAGRTISISMAELRGVAVGDTPAGVAEGDTPAGVAVGDTPAGVAEMPTSTIYVARDITPEAQAERMKSDFVSYVSHELRTPLTTIKMLVRLLLMDTPPATKPHEYLTVINTQVERQARLVSNLLDFARLEAGRYELPPEAVEPRKVIQTALSVCRPLAEEKGITIATTCGELSGAFTSNAGGLEQVLINLLSNAVKFTDPGGQITLSCHAEGEEMVFAVQDNGIGMTPEQLGRIFTKFYTVRNPEKRGEGTGLGLVISDMIVKKLGGRITVTSAPHQGSCFTARVPRAPLNADLDKAPR